MNIEVTWTNQRGAGCVRSFTDIQSVTRFISKLRREATIRINGEIIGQVTKHFDYCSDRRVKWLWWIDPEAGRPTCPKCGGEVADYQNAATEAEEPWDYQGNDYACLQCRYSFYSKRKPQKQIKRGYDEKEIK
jgi:hypothetical protein